jgi:hypothetical protein
MAKERVRWVRPLRDDEIDPVARDGEFIRVPVMMCDSLAGYRRGYAPAQLIGHQPGFVRLTDQQVAERARARAAWVRDLSDPWRTDGKRRKPDPDEENGEENGENGDDDENNDRRSASDARAAAYDGYVKRLTTAWRGPNKQLDVAQPDLGSRPEELMRRGTEGRTDPDAAEAVERRLEIELGRRGANITQLVENLERDRARIHSEFSQKLENAWKR